MAREGCGRTQLWTICRHYPGIQSVRRNWGKQRWSLVTTVWRQSGFELGTYWMKVKQVATVLTSSVWRWYSSWEVGRSLFITTKQSILLIILFLSPQLICFCFSANNVLTALSSCCCTTWSLAPSNYHHCRTRWPVWASQARSCGWTPTLLKMSSGMTCRSGPSVLVVDATAVQWPGQTLRFTSIINQRHRHQWSGEG